jgi:hypothetical protein
MLKMNGQSQKMKGHVEKKKVEGPPMLRMYDQRPQIERPQFAVTVGFILQ